MEPAETTAGQAAVGTNAAPAVPLLELEGISKRFPGVRALEGVSLEIRAGEVHIVVGENGAGKSTLMKILYGAQHADEGTIRFQGRPVTIGTPADARRLGIAVIFQEFSLVPFLSAAENIFLGREFRGPIPGTVDRRRAIREARTLLSSLGLDLDPSLPVHRLGVAEQQLVEIAKALSQKARILVMDEPTAALSERECDHLFRIVRRLRDEGVAIVYITHRLMEVMVLGDRITVLRDGRKVAELTPKETTPDDLVRLMVGRPVKAAFERRARFQPGEVALEIRNLRAPSGLEDINLTVHAREIVGLAGLVGAGRTEVARAIFGADPISAGEIRVFGRPAEETPSACVRQGIALIPEKRKEEGLALIRSVQDNLLMSALWRLFPRGWLRPRTAQAAARDMVDRLRVATPSLARPVRVLSGGTQQKVVVGKWLSASCRLFLFDEPTRGIDVGAKAEIFRLIEDLAERGAAVLLISSEFSEIVQVADRTYVMYDGRITGHLTAAELSEEALLRLAVSHE
jgi:ribose transport system ATP-binding protein